MTTSAELASMASRAPSYEGAQYQHNKRNQSRNKTRCGSVAVAARVSVGNYDGGLDVHDAQCKALTMVGLACMMRNVRHLR